MSTPAEQFDVNSFDTLAGTQGFDSLTGQMTPRPNVRDPGDDKLWVKFEMHSHLDDAKSREAGRPVFEMREYVRIIVPGDQTTQIHRPVRSSDLERFPRQYAAFKQGNSQVQGFPLTEWNQLTRAQCDELAFFKVQTVEQLAGMPDGLLQRFPGLVTHRDKAKLFLEERKSNAPIDKLRGEIASRDEHIRTMESQMKQMQEQLTKLSAEKASARK